MVKRAMNRRGRASTWWLLGAIVVFTLIGAWFARNEDSGRDDILEPPVADAQDGRAANKLADLERAAQQASPDSRTAIAQSGASGPTIRISGIVVDEDGAGIAAVRVGPSVPFEWVETAEDGTFDLHGVPVVDGSRLSAAREGYESVEIETPNFPTAGLRFVLKARTDQGLLRGLVVHADGSPAAYADVYLGNRWAPADKHGAFRFTLDGTTPDSDALAAVMSGSQAAVIPGFGAVAREKHLRPPLVHMKLGPPPFSILGHIVDPAGRSLAGWSVVIIDGTLLTPTNSDVTAEDLTGGTNRDSPPETDANGAFHVDGLFDREYILRAQSPKSSAQVESQPVRAGARGVEIVLPHDARVAPLKGRVVANDGKPIRGVEIRLGQIKDEGELSFTKTYETALTKDDGTFEFGEAWVRGADLSIGGLSVVPATYLLEHLDLRTPLELRAVRLCRVRLSGIDPGRRSWLAALDASGRPQSILKISAGNAEGSAPRVVTEDAPRGFFEGTTTTEVSSAAGIEYAVSEEATEFELYDEIRALQGKQTVHLVPDQLTVIAW
jgi:hypothetical protein